MVDGEADPPRERPGTCWPGFGLCRHRCPRPGMRHGARTQAEAGMEAEDGAEAGELGGEGAQAPGPTMRVLGLWLQTSRLRVLP